MLRIKKQIEELEKQLADKRAELERLEKQDKLKKYADINAGETFKYKGCEYTKLRNEKAIINDYDSAFMDCSFDNVDNDYEESLIKYYIHSDKFIKLLKLNIEDFESCELLSKEEYEENKDIIKDFENYWWLRSGDYYTNYDAQYVYGSGGVSSDDVGYSDGGVRPAFGFKNDIEVEVINE